MAGTGKVNQLVARLPHCWKPRHRDDLARLGPKCDGGYVITENIIRNTDYVVGLGVGTDWKFEEDFHGRKQIPVHCYDHTISLRRFIMDSARHILGILRSPRVRNIRRLNDPVNFLPLKYIVFFRGKIKHYMEKIGLDPAHETDFRKIFSRIPLDRKVFIKIDIDGGEYGVLKGLGDYQQRVTGLVVEFHHLIFLKDLVRSLVSDLNQFFDIVHVHVNNFHGINAGGMPGVIEITFENKNLGSGDDAESEKEYPLEGLDYPNAGWLEDFKLLYVSESGDCWVNTSSSL